MKKIMVIDDDDGISEVMKIMLEGSGYQVTLLKNGKVIEKKVLQISPQLIFLDIWMPGIDGKEVTKLLKRNPSTKAVPIIIISALSQTEKIAKEVGADGFLAKPFDMNALLALAAKYT